MILDGISRHVRSREMKSGHLFVKRCVFCGTRYRYPGRTTVR